ncbi:GIY-YIG nuclease family protein [Gemmobacter nectariphilus]|uniref:GIY-YIG nuclease family protein n=1 Tax=Gemmobacter nectariphilus TaxID=220343 RepID=UPI0003FFEF98|nr:GIY-YIG nuclease family protein [Gemmobacter nectariphilus]
MTSQSRKAAVAAWKDRKPDAGIYAVTCGDLVWVGSTPALAAIRNRLWFTLSQGGATNRAMQAAWTAHGEAAFGFEVLERIEEEDSQLARAEMLKDRAAHWRAARGAQAV